MRILKYVLIIIVLFIASLFFLKSIKPIKTIVVVPAGKRYTKIDKEGITVLPNGRFITPIGKTYTIAPHPYGLILSKDDNTVVTANSGVSPLSISIIRGVKTDNVSIMQIPPGMTSDKGVIASVFMGLAIPSKGGIVYVAGGQENKIYVFNLKTGEKISYLDCSYRDEISDYSNGYIGDIVLSKNDKFLYAVDQIGFRVIIFDTKTRKIIKNISVGRYPFGIALSPDGNSIYVANVGMYEYKIVKGVDFDNLKKTALNFPASPFLSERSINGFKKGENYIPPLGNPNVIDSFSVWKIDTFNPEKAKVVSKVKTGRFVGEMIDGVPAVGGSSPNSITATPKYVFVSNGNNDTISVIDTKTFSIKKEIQLYLDKRLKKYRGIIPFGLDVSPDYKLLYVAEAGVNAVGVIDINNLKLIGHIPVGWFPSKIKVSSSNKFLVVANAKGYGSGPNGGKNFKEDKQYNYIGYLMRGSLSIVKLPLKKELRKLTKKVINNNFRFYKITDNMVNKRKNNPIPIYPGEKKSPIKYIVFISKENRTFDEVLGQKMGVEGEPDLARYGLDIDFSNKKGTVVIKNGSIMVNHFELANKFAISDNFYVDSDVSADGHRWLVNTYPNEWVETTTPASYGDNRDYKKEIKSPGIFAFNGAAGAIYPEDYNEKGSMWEHLERNGISFFNFGFGLMFEPASYNISYTDIGMRYFINYPTPYPMYERTSKEYPTFNMAIPDQFRVSRFIEEFKKRWLYEKKRLPSLLTIILPNDHGAEERPKYGYPFRESYMVDNDLALGRIIEFLSHTQYWKNMAIFVTEDDAQGGVDHIDAHRSILMVISPYAKKNYVGKYHYSFGSIFKTFWNILNIPYLNQYDATANDLSDLFTDVPDFTPYSAIPIDRRIFDPQKALDPFDKNLIGMN
jgi:YVTN family beta-propeller protein